MLDVLLLSKFADPSTGSQLSSGVFYCSTLTVYGDLFVSKFVIGIATANIAVNFDDAHHRVYRITQRKPWRPVITKTFCRPPPVTRVSEGECDAIVRIVWWTLFRILGTNEKWECRFDILH